MLLRIVTLASCALAVGAGQARQADPAFDVVSIRRNTDPAVRSAFRTSPDGGIVFTNIPLASIVSQRAFEPLNEWQVAGMPDWARTERYDVIATGDPAVPAPTPEQRQAMVRGMLTERFRMVTHFETRELPVYELVIARGDGKLGSKIRPIQEDCVAIRAAAAAAREAGRVPAPPPPAEPIPTCFFRMANGRWEGDVPFELIPARLQTLLRQPVIDKTGLNGYYHIDFEYRFETALTVGQNASTDVSLFTLVQEQLGLNLKSGRAPIRVLVIDRLEPPTPN
jgi:uncharacterized protein (TIGR03435 family)